jgi:hypothetical protein
VAGEAGRMRGCAILWQGSPSGRDTPTTFVRKRHGFLSTVTAMRGAVFFGMVTLVR